MRKWTDKVLWFVIGVVTAGSLMVISTSRAVAPPPAVTPQCDHTDIERRLNAMEERFRRMDKAAAEEAQRERRQRRQSEGPPDFRDRP